MDIAVFGGAFDPVHLGHCGIIDHLLNDDSFDNVCLVPTGVPVFHKDFLFPAEKRLHMLNILYKDHPRVHIIDYEINKATLSYMKETLNYVDQKFYQARVTLVIGYDQFIKFHDWKFYQDILINYQLLVIFRHGIGVSKSDRHIQPELTQFQQHIRFSDCQVPDISSSNIREQIKQNQDISSLVHNYILPHIKLDC